MYKDMIKKLESIKESNFSISLGFDGYVDEIIDAVSSRKDIDSFKSIKNITEFGERILNAAGKSTNIELVTSQFKLGGNGPILGNSIANIGVNVNYIGALGSPQIHDVFSNLHENFHAKSIEKPGHTMALEFEDGKIMFGRLAMKELSWDLLTKKIQKDDLIDFFSKPNLVGIVNWTQTPHMQEIWDKLLYEFLPSIEFKSKPYMFIDLADPQKRSQEDIIYMLKQLTEFEKYYSVILGLNEKESQEIANTIDLPKKGSTPNDLKELAHDIKNKLNITCCVIHPVTFAVCAIKDETFYQEGPYTKNPLISTGAGDHFNAGFCFGIIGGLTPSESLLMGVANSGFYVRTAKSANKKELMQFINDWKSNQI